MTGIDQSLLKQISARVVLQGPTVRNRQQGNGQHAALMEV